MQGDGNLTFRLADLKSSNGTFLNGERVTGDVPTAAGRQRRVGRRRSEIHFRRAAAAAAFVLLAPAHAAPSYYIVRNTVTNECKIVTQLPRVTKVSKSTMVVQSPVVYKKKSEARAALKAVQVCSDM